MPEHDDAGPFVSFSVPERDDAGPFEMDVDDQCHSAFERHLDMIEDMDRKHHKGRRSGKTSFKD